MQFVLIICLILIKTNAVPLSSVEDLGDNSDDYSDATTYIKTGEGKTVWSKHSSKLGKIGEKIHFTFRL